jgi:hypothetical protein
MLQLTAFSQKDTDTIPVKTFPIPTVRLIIKDIIVGDSAIAELKLTQEENRSLQETILDKNRIIKELNDKHSFCQETLDAEKERYDTLQKLTLSVQDDLHRQKTNNKWNKIISGTILGALITILIIK